VTVAVSFAMTAIMVVVTVIVVIVAMIIVIAVAFTILRGINVVVPVVADEIDRPTAGSIAPAIPFPIFLVARWHAQIQRLMNDTGAFNDDRFRVNNLGLREATEVDAPIKSWLADVDRHADIGGERRQRRAQAKHDCKNYLFHKLSLSITIFVLPTQASTVAM
jgi:hypothetical protein